MSAGGGGGFATLTTENTGSLQFLNSCSRYDLSDKLKLFFGDDNEENVFLDDMPNRKYFDMESFIKNCKQLNCIFLSLNVCSLMSKFDELSSLIIRLSTSNVNIKIIALQEIWNIPYPELVNIPNFKFAHKVRNVSKGGGVAFYVRNDIHFKIVSHLSHFIEKEFECLTIEATINRKKILLSNIYRSPNPLKNTTQAEHTENFMNYFDTHLYNLSMKNCDSFVFLDSNINLLTINNNQNAALYLETIYSNGYLQKVGKATRICKSAYSLIDHIVYKSNQKNMTSGTIVTDLSDHFINFIGLSLTNLQTKNEYRLTRNFSKVKIDIAKICG